MAHPRQLQWLAGPKWQRAHDTDANVNALVSAGGRVFYMVDEAPIGLPGANGLPDKWLLVARDAFNGLLLWKVPVKKWGWREYKDTHYRTRHDIIPVNVHRRVVATDESVFATLGIGAPVSRLDAATGEIEHVYAGTEGTREILYDQDQLILTVPAADGLKIAVVNAGTGDIVWQTTEPFAGSSKETGRLAVQKQAVLNTAASGDSLCLLDGAEIVCLDRATGAVRWHARPPAMGSELSVGTLIIHQNVVIFAEQGLLTATVLGRRRQTVDSRSKTTRRPVVFVEGRVHHRRLGMDLGANGRASGFRSTWARPSHGGSEETCAVGTDLQCGSSSPMLSQQGHIPIYHRQSSGSRIHRFGGRTTFGKQLGPGDLPSGHDAGQRTALRAAGTVQMLLVRAGERFLCFGLRLGRPGAETRPVALRGGCRAPAPALFALEKAAFLPLPVAVLLGGALVVLLLAAGQAEGQLGAAALPVEGQRHEGSPCAPPPRSAGRVPGGAAAVCGCDRVGMHVGRR